MSSPRLAAHCALAALILVAAPSAASADQFLVNSTDDAVDATNNDQICATAAPVRCTLRAAIQAANDTSEASTVIVPAGTYNLTLGAAGESLAASGDLDIHDAVDIQGAGAESTTIAQMVAGDPVFDYQTDSASRGTTGLHGVLVTGGDLGGIQVPASAVTLTVTDSAIVGNTNNSGLGGGISAPVGTLILDRTTVSGNSASTGGGISLGLGVQGTLTNSTISGNTAQGSGGGGGLLTTGTSGGVTTTLTNTTVASNTAIASGSGGGVRAGAGGPVTLRNTIVSGNSGGNCFGSVASLGNNLENSNTCNLTQSTDKPGFDPLLGPLADNGGETQTHALGSGSPAIDGGGGCPPPATDQRGTQRAQGAACDIGSYEFVFSKTMPSLPDCSPTGTITLAMDPPAGETPVAFKYKIDDGPTQTAPTSDETEPINLPEGRFKLEYWSQTNAGEEPQASHLVGTALIDKTDPTLSVASDQNQDIYVITRTASVTVAAGDPLSGLTVNPSAQNDPVATATRGAKTVEWTAKDLCDNTTTRQFDYTVLGPGLGERAVIEPLGEDVRVSLPAAAGARASQKGADFEAVTQPREIPIGTRVDAREGTARITSSKSATEGDIQDGAFAAGVFQVLQSRNQDRKGLTELELKGSNFRNCEAGEGGAGAARLSRQARRRLRGNATGRFRTRGRHSAATVRGTKWTVTDRCDGTLTKVGRGTVAVRDFRLKKTITLTRGESYLALAEPEPPKLGKTVNVEPVKGEVFVKLPPGGNFARASQKGSGFVPLTEARSIPVRSIIDTTKGTVALRTARSRKGNKVQSGRFAAGVFQVLQSRKRREKGLTEVRLKGSAAKFRRCGGKGSATARASLSRRTIRRLRARARGRYRTRGRHSAATVRGTVWNVTDRCDGTLTTVRRGKVAVRDFRLKKTVVLTRGKSYLARPR